MFDALRRIKSEIYDKCGWVLSDYKEEPGSHEYEACKFQLNSYQVMSRTSKITPKKTGQFVTCWKRINNNIEPINESDIIDFIAINVITESKMGQFVFPKSVLIEKGIISTNDKLGKLALRVYPSWDNPGNKNAEKSQLWQLKYFYELDNLLDLNKVIALYNSK